VIVGAGPAGVVSGCLLARQGFNVTLIERHESFDREFRGERLMPESQEALKQAGLWPFLASVPQHALTTTQVHLDRCHAYTVDIASVSAPPIFMSQPPMLEAIVAQAEESGRFRLIRDTTIEALEWREGRVSGVSVLTNGASRHLDCDLLIGGDGRGSAVRRLADLEAGVDMRSEAYDVVWCKIIPDHEILPLHTSRVYSGRNRMAFCLPAPDGSIQIGFSLPKGAFRTMKSDWVSELIALVDPEIGQALDKTRTTLRHSLLNVICFTLTAWTRPGVVLIGDAAHPMSPAGGQGIAMALADALRLAEKLSGLSGASSHEIDAACDAFAAERRQQVLAVQSVQRRLARIYFQGTMLDRFIVRYAAPVINRFAGRLVAAGLMGPKKLRSAQPPRVLPAR